MSNLEPKKPADSSPDVQRELLARLYREIGISAVAAALAAGQPTARPRRVSAAPLMDRGTSESAAA